MKHIVYKTTNLVNDKFYVGVHGCMNPDVFDGYLGSGKVLLLAKKKYGKEKFKRETLFTYETPEEAYLKEAEIVDEEFVAREDTYNIVVGGDGFAGGENHPNWGKHLSEETKGKISLTKMGNKNPMFGKIFSVEHLKNLCLARVGMKSPMLGKHHTKETKKKMSEDRKGENCYWYGKKRSPETIQKMNGWRTKENHPFYGKHFSEEHCNNIRIANSPSQEFIDQRRSDIENMIKDWGWKTKLAEKWCVGNSAVTHFIYLYAGDLVESKKICITMTPEILAHRRLDIENSSQQFGWQKMLSEKWNLNSATVCNLLKIMLPI